MQKVYDNGRAQVDSLHHSLNTIKATHAQLDQLTSSSTTPTTLASQIDLCNMLLFQISGIRSDLAKRLRHKRVAALRRTGESVGLN